MFDKVQNADGSTTRTTRGGGTVQRYPNGDLVKTDKSGRVSEYSKIREDGKRERDGK